MTTGRITTIDTRKTTEVEVYEAIGGKVSLSAQIVQTLFAPKATPLEAYAFLRFCVSAKLNPFVKDAYLIKYDVSAPASIVIGKDAFIKRAEAHPSYDGFQAGIIFKHGGEQKSIEGALLLEGDELIGGWCKVYRRDRKFPSFSEVSLKEYNRKQSLWNTHTSTMIRKVAVVQALREAFPELWGGIKTIREEYGLAVTQEQEDGSAIVNGETVELQDIAEQQAPQEAAASTIPTATKQATEPKPARHMKTLGDLFQGCLEDYKMTRAQVLTALGYGDSSEISDIGDAWAAIQKMKEAKA